MRQKKKTIVNLVVSIFTQALTVILGLVVPRIVLTHYGSDTNGLTNTISQIFVYVSLLEAGISVSARNAFYKPIKDNNRDEISFVASLKLLRYFSKLSPMIFEYPSVFSLI